MWKTRNQKYNSYDAYITIDDRKAEYGELQRLLFAENVSLKQRLERMSLPLEDFHFSKSLSIVVEADCGGMIPTFDGILDIRHIEQNISNYEPFGLYFSIEEEKEQE